ncbi:MAG TPA: SGNH/GDSL hydrolase family protein [Candidatus Binatia bacterium]|nr:SGNH/GDSL hydrolase family protein [Candidatus Binatia bacterium]
MAKQFGVEFDTRSKIEVIDDLRRQGVDAVPNVFPRGLLEEQEDGSLRSAIRIGTAEILPLGGISNKVTVLCNETGAYTIYHSDEHGFHNPAGIWSLDRLHLAAVGDSFAHGACVSPDRNFIAHLRMSYPATLNLSMSGNGPLLELASLKEYLPRFMPEIVLWFYFEGNDLGELTRKMKSPLLNSYLEEDFSQGLRARQVEIDEALLEYVQTEKLLEIERQEAARQKSGIDIFVLKEIVKVSALREKLGFVYGDALSNHSTAGTIDAVNTLGEILSEAKASVEAWDGQLYVVYLPEWDRYARPEFANKDRERVLRMLETLNIPVIDLHPAFHAHADPLSLFPFRRFGHYNEEGNRVVADTVLRSISVKTVLLQSES